MPLNEYEPGTAFPGLIGRTTEESSPAWPRPLRADAGSPNVLFIVLDDVGYGQLGCYGSPIATPNLDALAAGGLLYTNMHTTALCSPSRSCIITGRNHHANATAAINELATGYPGYNGQIPFENGFLSEMLQQHGYSTYMVGKYHLMPSEFESAAGPFDRWPLGRGFERFYGFLGGDASQWHPELVYDNHQVEPPRTPEQGYHLTEDLADKAIEFIADAKQVAPHKPFYLHFCTGAGHAPHHVPKEWADKYAGQFNDGWDAYRERTLARQKELGVLPANAELSRHDPDVPEWESLSPDARRLAARMMEVFAGFLSHTDHHIGRLLALPEGDRRVRQHADHGGLRQRRQRRGRADRDHQRAAVLQQRTRVARGKPGEDRRPGRPGHLQPLPVGLDLGGQHAVPAVEAGNLPRRYHRPVPGALAAGHQVAGSGAGPVRAHRRHGPHRPGRARPPAARGDQGSDPVAAARHQLRPLLRRGGRPHQAPRPVLRDVRPPGHRPRRLAGGVPVAGALVRRGREAVRRADHRGDADQPGRQPLGAVPRG